MVNNVKYEQLSDQKSIDTVVLTDDIPLTNPFF